MAITLFQDLTRKEKSDAVERLIKGGTPSQDFFLMITLSILTATFGILLNSVPVIIGSMLIAPMLYPILSLSLGIIMSDPKLISRSLYTIGRSTVLGIMAAAVATLLFSENFNEVSQVIANTYRPSMIYVAIAVVAGLAASFALVKPQLSETLPGIAISVALIPPLAAIGIGLARINPVIIREALLLFASNILGIIFASMVTFALMNFYAERSKADKDLRNEEKKLERAVKRAKTNS